MPMHSYYNSMLFLLPPILYMSSFLLARNFTEKKPTTHGLKAHPLLGHLPAFVKNSHCFLDWTTELIVGSPEMRMAVLSFLIAGRETTASGLSPRRLVGDVKRVPAGEPIPVHGVPRRGEDVPREGDGVRANEVQSRYVLEEFVVDLVKEVAGGGVPEHVLSITLRMKGGLLVKIRRKAEAY
uniref:Uncharacterized protein n=1 Tax=Oryza punctata TaxID=4537 RepID=A0A0E0MC79_ORYPU